MIAEREVEYIPTAGEDSASYASSIINSSLNIFKYEDGKECVGILILLLWIKIINYGRSTRYPALVVKVVVVIAVIVIDTACIINYIL